MNEAAYAELVAALEAEGFEVRLERPFEQRGLPGAEAHPLLIEVLGAAVLGAGAKTVFDRVADAVISRLGAKRRGTRTVPLYGPDGEIERYVKLPTPTD